MRSSSSDDSSDYDDIFVTDHEQIASADGGSTSSMTRGGMRQKSCASDFTLAVKYTATDIAARPRNWSIGFCSTFVVVFFVGLILVGISKTPVIFLRFAETTTGEMDALLLAAGSTPFLNFTEVEPLIQQSDLTAGSVPRWLLRGQLFPDRNSFSTGLQSQGIGTTTTAANSSDNSSSGAAAQPVQIFAGTSILIGDTFKEKALGIGRGWPYRPIGYAETQVLDTVLNFLNVRPNVGDRTVLNIDIAGILRQQGVDPTTLTAGLFGGGGAAAAAAGGAGGAVPVVPIQPNTTLPVAGPNGTTTNVTADALVQALINGFGGNISQAAAAALVEGANGAAGTPLAQLLAGAGAPSAAGLTETLLSPTLGLTVADGFDEPYGKFPSTLGNMLVMDQRFLVRMLIDQLCYETVRNPFGALGGGAAVGAAAAGGIAGLPSAAELEETLKVEQMTLIIVAMMKDRYNIYYSEPLERAQKITRFSNSLFRALGLGFGGEAQYPIAIALVAFDFFSLFLTSLFSSVVAVVLVMGFLLVYTLLLTNTEERSFEVAMLRAQGMNKAQLLWLLVSQATAFIVPAISLAMAVLLAVNALLEVLMSSVTLAPAETDRVSVASMVFPVVMGVVIPIVANYRPARSVLTSALKDALSMYRHAASETTVTVMKLAELGLAPWQTLVGWLLLVGGFIVYYLIPLSFVFNELSMFFILMNVILLGMLLGLCLITFTIQERVEKVVLWLILWGKDKCLSMLIKKNLAAHSDRNSKAFLMFTITSASLIFGGALFTLLAVSISDTVRVVNGADISVQSLVTTSPLNKTIIDLMLSYERDGVVPNSSTTTAADGSNNSSPLYVPNVGKDKKWKKAVESWSYATFSLNDFPQIYETPTAQLSTVIGFPSRNLQVQGIDENLLDTVFDEFVLINSKDDNIKSYPSSPQDSGKPDIFKSLYTVPPVSVYSPVGEIFTGFPPNRTKPDILIKYDTVIPIVLASSAESVLGLSAGSAATVSYEYKLGSTARAQQRWGTVFLGNTRALVDKLSGFPTMTNLQIAFGGSMVLTSFDGFGKLLRANEFDFGAKEIAANPDELGFSPDAITSPVYGRLWIRLSPGLSSIERADFANRLRLVLNPYFHLAVDTDTVVASVQTASDLITYFFYFVAVVSIILDTFMLWLTFISNIQLNSWSIGVLRSLGFTGDQVVRAFVYEALVLVLGSFLCGTIIGLVVAVTVILQMALLLTLPFQMMFPWSLFIFLLGLSIFSALAASIFPARAIMKQPISIVLKKG